MQRRLLACGTNFRLHELSADAYLPVTGAILRNWSAALPRCVAVILGLPGHKTRLQAESATASRREVPTMTSLMNLSVLIVDSDGEAAFGLRQSFVAAGAKAHVVANLAAAERLLEAKSIDAVVLPYSQDPQTVDFCRMLGVRNIPSVFTSEPPPRYPTRQQMSGAIIAVKGLIAESGLRMYHSIN